MAKKADALAVLIERLRPTERQRAVLCLMMEGRTNRQIASEIGLKPKTIANYTAQLRAFAKELGYEFLPEKGGSGLCLITRSHQENYGA